MKWFRRAPARVFILYDHTYSAPDYEGLWNLIGIFSTMQRAEIARDHLRLQNPSIKPYEVDWRYFNLPPIYLEHDDPASVRS